MKQQFQLAQILTYILLGMGFLFLWVLYRTAWLSDDAYISYRCIENFVTGHGFTFNPGYRVQAYTHPLWAFLHIPFRLFFSNMYYIGLFVSMTTSIAAISWMILKTSPSTNIRIFLLAAIISSACLIDFSTSGLENPLSNLLLVLICLHYFKENETSQRLLFLSFLLGLLLLNRMDNLLLVAPILLTAWGKQKSVKAIGIVLLGVSPFLLWELCAIIYYGFPFPMTAYAKLNTSIARGDLLIQGIHYMGNFFTHDPISGTLLVAGIMAPFFFKRKKLYPLVIGILLYLGYILYIGGDFMQGRFFCSPLLLSLLILSQLIPKDLALYCAPVIVLLGLFAASPPLLSHPELGASSEKEAHISAHGIANERTFYFPYSGWIAGKGKKMPIGEWVNRGKEIRGKSGKLLLADHQGFLAYFAGPDNHIVDGLALTDPFLAQLPNVYRPDWRPGHNKRLIPRGYLESLNSGKNELVSPDLQKVFTAIQQITAGPIWDKDRFKTMWDINFTDTYAKYIDQEFYKLPIVASIPEKQLSTYTQGGLLIHTDAGFEIPLSNEKPLQQLQVWLQKDCSYICVFRQGSRIIRGSILSANSPEEGVSRFSLPIPDEPMDNIVLYPNTAAKACQVHDILLKR